MKLSIITINRNNAQGLKKTMQSVVEQTSTDIEYIVVDGASTDESVDIIKSFADQRLIRWVSERDNGIYNAMNKGIGMAQGEYVMILNSGDYLATPQVIEQMNDKLVAKGKPDILYGNMIKIWPDGKTRRDYQLSVNYSLFDFYQSTLNPDGTYIRRSLFHQFGPFDETMKICSDWAWMLKTIGLGGVKPSRVNIDTLYFDMTGVSESGERSRQTIQKERRQVLQQTLPAPVLADYDRFAADITLMRRIHRHPWAFRLVRFLERCLFKYEKWKAKR
ncbi:MAG: glycosyltransferase [Bacteroidales bacterium]|nr:glycosyltransferase [Bacteroidales bacterium]MBR3412615.1 glycosyltransferase [Bacteroidales bacterium]